MNSAGETFNVQLLYALYQDLRLEQAIQAQGFANKSNVVGGKRAVESLALVGEMPD